ncbi:MAG: 16S rRNA (uracil(1498)-N(3))-methyltransferase [Candidatus Cloacimonetes bacterium]|nr:16S rRNA (uracil(1498)-N(3))-methyltransferase [Candidatus Cloacimonadota bacterium]
MPCFYTPQLVLGMKNLTIEGEEYHHIVNVFRKKQEDQILLTNGRGLLTTALIDTIEKKSLLVKTISSQQKEKSKPTIAVGFSLLRNKNDHFVIEKLTELGVSEFYPFMSQYSGRTASENTREKFNKTAIAAIKQCDNPFLPIIKEVEGLEKTIELLLSDGCMVLAAQERETSNILNDCFNDSFPEKIALIFGPEGGFSDEELELFKAMNVNSFTICSHILRAETAAIAGVSQLLLTIKKKYPEYF